MNKNKKIIYLAFAVFLVAGMAWSFSAVGDKRIEANPELALASSVAYYSPTCGCCSEHLSYMERMGFDLEKRSVSDVVAVKRNYEVPSELYSCHTTIIEGYVVEGHMPMEAIEKLLEERPDIKGIALPGMPQGSPGMPGRKVETWTIHTIENDGSSGVFMEM